MKYTENCLRTESGVSELIGALILISIIVLVVAVIAAGMISRPSAEKVPQVRFSVVNSSSIGGSYSVSITHDGGDEIPGGEYAVFNNGIQINNITVSPSNSGTTWSIGKTLVVNTGTEPSQISVYYYGKTVSNPALLGQRTLGNATTTATATIPTTTTTTSPTPTPCQPPVTSFTVNQTSGCTPLTVQFTDTSTGTPASWNWSFGDGSISAVQNPVHTYTSAGNYTVTLISGNTCGSNTSTVTGLVQAYGGVAPINEAGGFWYLNDGSGISVSDSSGHGNTGTVTSGKWVNCPAPGRAYLIFNGNSAYVSIPNSASLTPANQVSFEAWVYPTEQKTAKVIQKRDWDGHGIDQDIWQGWQGGVTLSNGTKHDVTWSPGGGNLQPVLRTWYYVVLTYDGAALRIYVNGVERNSIPLTGALRQFSAPVIIGSTTSQKYFNGSIANVAMYPRALSKCEIAARYAAFTPQGCAPVTSFIATPTSGISPLAVQFTDQSAGTPTSWSWNFGDGTTSILQNPSHTYSAIGDYTVSLTTANVFGSNTATKGNYIQVTKTSFVNYIIDENVFIYGNKLDFEGNTLSGSGATIVITGPLTTSDLNRGAAVDVTILYIGGNVNLDGGSAGLGSESKPGAIYVNGDLYLGNGARDIYGDVYVARNFYLKDAHINGNVYVNGDLTLDWTPTLAENTRIYYTGKFKYPPSMSKEIVAKCIYQEKVPGFTMPDQTIPPVKPTEWYDKHGYLPGGDLTSGIKIFSGSYSSTKSKNNAENVVIVASQGDITITGLGGNGVTGVLFAPYGKVTFEGGFFEGVVIARDGFFVTSGGTKVTFVNFAKYFSSPDDYPL